MDLRAEAPGDLDPRVFDADPRPALGAKHRALLDYATKVTQTPAACCREDIAALRTAGASDEEIHATVQVCAYFNYINRVADALGVDLEPEMRRE